MSLTDANLNNAYSDLAWLRKLIEDHPVYAGLPGSASTADPVLSLLEPLDWKRGAAEEHTDHMVKAARAAQAASDEIYAISQITNGYWSGVAADSFSAVINTMKKDYDDLHDELTGMHKAISGVYDGLDEATKSIAALAGDIKAKYGYLVNEAETLAGQGASSGVVKSDMAQGISDACQELSNGVGDVRSQIAGLAKGIKDDTAPLHIYSG